MTSIALFRRSGSLLLIILLSLCQTLPVHGADRQEPGADGSLRLQLRKRVETFRGSDVWDEITLTRDVPVSETAVIICDMWDKHWCPSASKRCDALAHKMAPVIAAVQ